MLKIAALALLAILVTGCSSLHTNQSNAPLNATINANLKANIDVGGTITGNSKVTTIFGIFSFGDNNKYSDGVNYGVNSGGFSSIFGGAEEEAKSAAV